MRGGLSRSYVRTYAEQLGIDPGFRTGRVHFDMGDISENWYFGSGDADSVTLNTEDVSNRGVFDELTEDTGLDNAFDLNEEFESAEDGFPPPGADEFPPDFEDETPF